MRSLVLLFVVLLAACGGTEAPAPQPGASIQPLANELAYASLDPESRAAVDRSPVPVLLLPERFAADAHVMAGPRWLAIAYSKEGLTLSLHATDHAAPALSEEELQRIPRATHEVRGVAARTTVNDGIRAVTWEHEGVAYSLEVECADVLEDSRCAAPTFALALADELVALPSTFERGAHRAEGSR
jgi:hypothetical protein